jgi:MFS family permease
MSKESASVSLSAPLLRAKVPLSQPLRHARFRQLWIANLISNLGTWVQTFASAWLIASVSQNASTTTLVQTATYIPIFLFALLAGVIADAVDRPKFLFACNLFMAACACAMAALVMSGNTSTVPVLLLTFCLGSGAAFMWPAWQASMSALVEPDELEAAATLNNLSYNVAGVLGPALGGLLFHWIGAGPLFLVNALSFVGLLAVYRAWIQEPRPAAVIRTDFLQRLREGMRSAFGCERYRHILFNVCTVFFATIAFAALLPVYVRDVLRMNSTVYGTLMGSLGAGAILAAFLLPGLRTRIEKTKLLSRALFVYGAMLLIMPMQHSLMLLVPLIVCGGMAWSATVSTLNAAAQASFPCEIRARTLSIYLFVMAGGYTVGSMFWGAVADLVGVKTAYTAAGALVIVNALVLASSKRKAPI